MFSRVARSCSEAVPLETRLGEGKGREEEGGHHQARRHLWQPHHQCALFALLPCSAPLSSVRRWSFNRLDRVHFIRQDARDVTVDSFISFHAWTVTLFCSSSCCLVQYFRSYRYSNLPTLLWMNWSTRRPSCPPTPWISSGRSPSVFVRCLSAPASILQKVVSNLRQREPTPCVLSWRVSALTAPPPLLHVHSPSRGAEECSRLGLADSVEAS